MQEIVVDWTRCDGHGLCAALEPQRIARDEWGFPLFRRTEVTTAEEEKEARRTVAACPALALRLTGRTTRRSTS